MVGGSKTLVVLTFVIVGLTGHAGPVLATDPAQDAIPTPVLFIADSGINPYHIDFRAPPDLDDDTYPDYYPAEAERIELTLDAGSYDEARAADAEIWESLEFGKLYAFVGTRIVGGIDFTDPGACGDSCPVPILEEGGTTTNPAGHGTRVSSSAVGERAGGCPECRLVIGTPNRDEAFAWALQQEWIDAVSNSYGAPAGLGNPFRSMESISRDWTGSGRSWFEAAGNSPSSGAVNHLSHTEGPPWVFRVGHHGQTPSLWDLVLYSQTFEVIGTVEKPVASPMSLEGYTTGTGTSMAAPDVAGRALSLLREVRQEFQDPGGVRDGVLARASDPSLAPQAGPLSDGELTAEELEEVLRKTAREVPTFWSLPEPLRYFEQGFGLVDADSLEDAKGLLFEGIDPPANPWAQWWYEVDQYARWAYGGTYGPCKPIPLPQCLDESPWDPVGDLPGVPPL